MTDNKPTNSDHRGVRVAVVTGANKGIGLETVRQLCKEGVTVILTARDEKRGKDATASLHESGFTNVVFHQLDVRNPASVASLAKFIKHEFNKLDILVNNAGHSGVIMDVEGLKALNIDPESWLSGKATNLVQGVMKTTFESAEICLDTNYYGCKRVIEALIPLLKLSTQGARIVNVTSLRGELKRVPSEVTRATLANVHDLTEEKMDELVQNFLQSVKEERLEANGWSKMLPAYTVSKLMLNAYTRILANRYPNMYINCVHPGYVDTDLNWHTGTQPVDEGARGPVKLALLPNGGTTGCYFDQTEMGEF